MKLDRPTSDAGVGLAAQLWTAGLGLLALPLLIGALGPERYAVLALSMSLLYTTAIGDLGVGRAVSKFVAEEGPGPLDEAKRYFETGFTLSLILGVGAGALLWAASPTLARWTLGEAAAEAREVFRLTALAGPALLLRILFVGVLVGKRRLRSLSLNYAVSDTLKVGAAAAAAVGGLGLQWVVGAYVGAAYLQTLLLAAQCFAGARAPARPRLGWRPDAARELLGFGAWGTAATAARHVAAQSDRWILGILGPLDALGYYALAREIASRLAYIPHHVARAYFPVFGREFAADPTAMRASYLRAQRLVIVMTSGPAALLALFAGPLLAVWVDAETARRAAGALALLALAAWAESLIETPATALFAGAGRPRTLAKAYAAAAAVQLTFGAAAAALWQATGAALMLLLVNAGVALATANRIERLLPAAPRSPTPAAAGPTAAAGPASAGLAAARPLATAAALAAAVAVAGRFAADPWLGSAAGVAATLLVLFAIYLGLAWRTATPSLHQPAAALFQRRPTR